MVDLWAQREASTWAVVGWLASRSVLEMEFPALDNHNPVVWAEEAASIGAWLVSEVEYIVVQEGSSE